MEQTGCCQPFNPEQWQDKEITWNNKLFVKDRVTNKIKMDCAPRSVEPLSQYWFQWDFWSELVILIGALQLILKGKRFVLDTNPN